VAINPDVINIENFSITDRTRFEKMPEQERMAEVYKFKKPYSELNVSQQLRQKWYESFVTTDDHLMHLTVMEKDQNGTKYYFIKNSWVLKETLSVGT
jgi:hypothetical protein